MENTVDKTGCLHGAVIVASALNDNDDPEGLKGHRVKHKAFIYTQ